MSKYKKIDEKKIKIKDEMSGYDKDVLVKTFRLPNGIIENFFINDDKDSVQIFALTSDNDVLTVRQFRPGKEEFCIELPGGGMEKGEDAAKAAARELLEETGYEGNLNFLGKMNYTPYSTGTRYMFVADNCKKVEHLNLDDNEFLQVVRWPLEKFRDKMKGGSIRGFDCAYAGLDFLGLL